MSNDHPGADGPGQLLRVQPLRILVVDDYKDAADMIAMLLVLSGHQVRVAYSAKEALREASD